MKNVTAKVIIACLIASTSIACLADTELLFDDFDGPTLDTATWFVKGADRYLSRTRWGNDPVLLEESGTTFVALPFDTYSPEDPGTKFKSCEISTLATFGRGDEGLIWEARVRMDSEHSGMIAGIFPFLWDNYLTDEIDFEYLTKQPVDNILTTTWNDFDERDGSGEYTSQMVTVPSFNRNDWNVLQIKWLPDHTEWYVNGTMIRSTTAALPDDDMHLFINLWSTSNPNWTDAYDASFQPVSSANQSTTYYLDVDYVKITAIGGGTPPPPPPPVEEPPAAPSDLSRRVRGSTVNLSWRDNSDNETGFEVYRAVKRSSSYVKVATVSADVKTYADQPGSGRWDYKVRAINDAGASDYSNTVSIRVR